MCWLIPKFARRCPEFIRYYSNKSRISEIQSLIFNIYELCPGFVWVLLTLIGCVLNPFGDFSLIPKIDQG